MGKWGSVDCLIIIVYAPQELKKKKDLWDHLRYLLINATALAIVLSDFNEVRSPNERKSTKFCPTGTKCFNSFI